MGLIKKGLSFKASARRLQAGAINEANKDI